MIEAVNSAIANAILLRGNVEQADASRASFAANPDNVQIVAPPQAPYVSPFIHLDVNYDIAVLQIRDSDTGDVLRQIPSETRLEQRTREQSVADTQTRVSPVQAQDISLHTPGQTFTAQNASTALIAAGAQSGQDSSGAGVSVLA